ARDQDARAQRRDDPRRRHGVEPRSRRRTGQADLRRRLGLFLHRRSAHRGNDPHRQAGDAVSQIRRPAAHRDARYAGPLDLRRDRSGDRTLQNNWIGAFSGEVDTGSPQKMRHEKEKRTMAKGFASTTDTAEKKISFDEIGPGLYAFTAEGDPNS